MLAVVLVRRFGCHFCHSPPTPAGDKPPATFAGIPALPIREICYLGFRGIPAIEADSGRFYAASIFVPMTNGGAGTTSAGAVEFRHARGGLTSSRIGVRDMLSYQGHPEVSPTGPADLLS